MLARAHQDNPFAHDQTRKLNRRPRILVADRDTAFRSTLIAHFKRDGWTTIPISSQQLAEPDDRLNESSLLILDLQLSQPARFGLLRSIRARSNIPIIVMGDHDCPENVRVSGLELGADDFVLKPLNLRELSARVRAVLRRTFTTCFTLQSVEKHARVRFAGWHLNFGTRRLTDPDGAVVRLTKGEFALLAAFLSAPQRTLTREQLLQAIRLHCGASERSIDVQVLRLRRKLRSRHGTDELISTERGTGYMFCAEVERLAVSRTA
jgi:two-component system, OmpR family, response regulator